MTLLYILQRIFIKRLTQFSVLRTWIFSETSLALLWPGQNNLFSTVEPKNNQKATKRAAVASGIFLLLSLSKIKMQQKAWELELKRRLI